eukprot:745896-Hanusia_phi.AAC.1
MQCSPEDRHDVVTLDEGRGTEAVDNRSRNLQDAESNAGEVKAGGRVAQDVAIVQPYLHADLQRNNCLHSRHTHSAPQRAREQSWGGTTVRLPHDLDAVRCSHPLPCEEEGGSCARGHEQREEAGDVRQEDGEAQELQVGGADHTDPSEEWPVEELSGRMREAAPPGRAPESEDKEVHWQTSCDAREEEQEQGNCPSLE